MKMLVIPKVDETDVLPRGRLSVKALVGFTEELVESHYRLQELNQHLCDEVAVLKGEKKRPDFKPSRMNEDAGKPAPTAQVEEAGQAEDAKPEPVKRPGSAKKQKTGALKIDHEKVIQPTEPLPPGSRFKGYRDFVVQDIVITTNNIRYRLACWQTPDGRRLTGQLPADCGNGHFGAALVSYIIYQHHQCQVTQPLLREQLLEWGVDISTGQIDAILSTDKSHFHLEKDALLTTGLAVSRYVTVDDTGTRHKGKNGYVTHIGNDSFAWFQSTLSKSRINFLELLRAGRTDYRIDKEALGYMKKQGLSLVLRDSLRQHASDWFADRESWHLHLDTLGIATERHRRIATEGALLGSLARCGLAHDLAIISDDAGQFKVLVHGLCWVHAERLIHKMLPLNEEHREDIARVRGAVWSFYADLKAYKLNPDLAQKGVLSRRFDAIFQQKTRYTSLTLLLRRLHENKAELLLVLERPEIPLHTNGSETDIRDHVKKQKVSGGTRSDLGRQCRDTFSSLKKTCRKLKISFWDYLLDRISCSDQIPPLSQFIEQRFA